MCSRPIGRWYSRSLAQQYISRNQDSEGWFFLFFFFFRRKFFSFLVSGPHPGSRLHLDPSYHPFNTGRRRIVLRPGHLSFSVCRKSLRRWHGNIRPPSDTRARIISYKGETTATTVLVWVQVLYLRTTAHAFYYRFCSG